MSPLLGLLDLTTMDKLMPDRATALHDQLYAVADTAITKGLTLTEALAAVELLTARIDHRFSKALDARALDEEEGSGEEWKGEGR